MNYAPHNPRENTLGAGITEDQIISAVAKSGYPLQTIVGDILRSPQPSRERRFSVQEEWSYLDRDTQELRSMDLVAELRLHDWNPQPRVRPQLDLLIECKQSSLPYIFFQTSRRPFLTAFPTVAGLRKDEIIITTDDDPSSWAFSVVRALDLHKDPFQTSPPFCHTLSKCVRKGSDIELSGSDAYNGLVMPLVKAVQHFVQSRTPVDTAWYFDCHLTLAIAILDAPMISITVRGDGPAMTATPWLRALRHEYEPGTDRFRREKVRVIDVVHKEFLRSYLDDHLLPFADRFAERVLWHTTELATGMAFVPHMGASRGESIESRMRPRTPASRLSRSAAIGRTALRLFLPRQRED